MKKITCSNPHCVEPGAHDTESASAVSDYSAKTLLRTTLVIVALAMLHGCGVGVYAG